MRFNKSIPPIPSLDFTDLAVGSHGFTSIDITDPYAGEQLEWIKCGPVSISRGNGHFNNHVVDCKIPGAKDFEHSTAIAFRLDLVGLDWEFMDNGISYFKGWIRADESDYFRIPDPSYNPLKDAKICKLKDCQDRKHVIVQEGFYIPPDNKALWELVRGRMVKIRTGSI